MKKYTTVLHHPFLRLFSQDSHDTSKIIKDTNTPIDKVLINYLNIISALTNPQYFTRLIVFVTLYREHVNSFNEDIVEDKKEYTTFIGPEEFPVSCNLFINDFMDPNSNDYDFSKEEAIDLALNIISWLYNNKFTCTQLSIIDQTRNKDNLQLKKYTDYQHFHNYKDDDEKIDYEDEEDI